MIFFLPLIGYYSASNEENIINEGQSNKQRPKLKVSKYFPTFILWFLFMATIRSIGDLSLGFTEKIFGLFSEESWKNFLGILKLITVQLLVVALAAVGLNTSFSNLKGLGWKPFVAGCLAASTVGVVSYLLIRVTNS
jgi:uncharacterized membrane protein YadS